MPYLVTTDGVPLYFEDEGPRNNSAIFLIHAEPFNTKFWQKNIGPMAKEVRVVSMDVRGRGESGKTDQGHNLAQYARDFRFMLESLGLERVVAAGWSMGSAILWRYVEMFGEDRMAGFADVDQRPYRFRSFDDLLEKLEAIRNFRLEDHRKAVVDYFGPEAKVSEGLIDWMAYECMKTPTSTHRGGGVGVVLCRLPACAEDNGRAQQSILGAVWNHRRADGPVVAGESEELKGSIF